MLTTIDTVADLWGLLVILILIVAGFCVLLFHNKTKVGKYIPMSLMLITVGVLLGGAGVYNVPTEISTSLDGKGSDLFRWAALIGSSFLIFWAGTSIDFRLFKKYGLSSVLIATVPIFIEGTVIALCLLPIIGKQEDGTFNWAIPFFIGYGIAAASPGIIVPILIKFNVMGYGKHNKINELALIGASVDDITSLGLLLVFFSLVVGVQSGNMDGASTATILFGRIPLMIILSVVIGIAAFYLYKYAIKKPLDKYVPYEVEVGSKKVKINNLLVIFSIILFVIGINELCEHSEKLSLGHLDEGTSWLFTNGFIALLVLGFLLSSEYRKDNEKGQNIEQSKTFAKWNGLTWTIIFAPLVFGNIGGIISFNRIAQWIMLAYAVIVVGAVFIGRTIGARISLYNRDKFKWNDYGVEVLASYPKGTTPAASLTFVALLISFTPDTIRPALEEYLLLPFFDMCIAAILITIPTGELLINWYYKKYMVVTTEDQESPVIPIPFFSKFKKEKQTESITTTKEDKDQNDKNKDDHHKEKDENNE